MSYVSDKAFFYQNGGIRIHIQISCNTGTPDPPKNSDPDMSI